MNSSSICYPALEDLWRHDNHSLNLNLNINCNLNNTSHPLNYHSNHTEVANVEDSTGFPGTDSTNDFKQQLTFKHTVTILNSNYNNITNFYNGDINYPCMEVEIDYIDNSLLLNNDDELNQYQSNLGFSYNANKKVLTNIHFNHSFSSSANSSFDNLSAPPISRSPTPTPTHLFSTIKKLKNYSLTTSITNLRFNSGSNYNFEFSAFTSDRLNLINTLAVKENIPVFFTERIFSLLSSTNLELKLNILKKISKISFNFVGVNLLSDRWCININLISNSLDGLQKYQQILFDFISLLSLLDSISIFIQNNESQNCIHLRPSNNNFTYDADDKITLLNYYNNASSEKLNKLKTFCSIQKIDPFLLEKMIYLFWRTEDHLVCAHFRQLFDNH